jgi:hypothetical protein
MSPTRKVLHSVAICSTGVHVSPAIERIFHEVLEEVHKASVKNRHVESSRRVHQ